MADAGAEKCVREIIDHSEFTFENEHHQVIQNSKPSPEKKTADRLDKMNSPDMCIVCFKKPEDDYILIAHHVSYFPEVIAFVHYDCHRKIHDMPLGQFIQYKDGDSRKFYDMKAAIKR